MIGFLRGKVAEKHPTLVVIDVGGVGYDVIVPLSTFSMIPELQAEVTLITYVHVREDSWQIFGFATKEEKELFKQLISISGIGPKLGITVLSGIERHALSKAIVEKDTAPLTAISGIGKKTAERMIIELQGKVTVYDTQHQRAAQSMSGSDSVLDDALTALLSLGYKKADAQTALKKAAQQVSGTSRSVESLVRVALQNM